MTDQMSIRRPPTDRRRDRGRRAAAPAFDPQARATELAILDALRSVVDPEIGMNVVELALIKQIILGARADRDQDDPDDALLPVRRRDDPAGQGSRPRRSSSHEVKVTLLAERWDPRDAGLVW